MNSLGVQIFLGIAGLALLYYGAEYLVRGGLAIAKRFKISSLIIGLTFVAYATSAPELMVSSDAALAGNGDISVGNIVGSNICNIALILGLCAVIKPLGVSMQLFKFDLPIMVLSAVVLAVNCYFTQGVSRIMGIVFLTGIIFYTWWGIKQARKHPLPVEQEVATPSKLVNSFPLALLVAGGGLAMLIVGAKFLVNSAVFTAGYFGVPDAIIALTVVAIGTSLPELATSVVATIHGERDIAIGNVVGSNIFNILGILGVAPLLKPIYSPGIDGVDLAVMVFFSIILLPIMYTGKNINRLEGAFLLLMYAGYTAYLMVK